MGIIAKVGGALQQVFGRIAEEAAEASGVIVRKRKFTGLSLARTFVLGYLRNPEATDEELRRSLCKVAPTSHHKRSISAIR